MKIINKMKKYYITEDQYNFLLNIKKNEYIYNNIVNEIREYELNLNESILLNEGVVDILKKYAKRGLLTTALISSLLSNNIVSAEDLKSAGVPENKIENVETSKFSHMEILNELIKILKTRGNKRDKPMFDKLVSLNDDAQKKITQEISSKITDLKDMWNYKYNILTKQDSKLDTEKESISQIDKEEVVQIDTTYSTTLVDNLQKNFENNSAKIKNLNQVKEDLKKIFNGYYEIDEIMIKTSSNTLRNTGDFENMTWEESSLMRANNIKKLIKNIEYSLGCDNPVKKIDESKILVDASGENGDGTSGPKSPYEVENKYIQYYKSKNIDEKYWKSNAKKSPLDNIKDYEKFNYVKIYINGVVLEQNESVYRNFKYLQMLEIDSGKKISKKIRLPKLFGGGKPKQYDGGKVGAKKCTKP